MHLSRIICRAAVALTLPLAFTSCIRDEALNAECDITGVDSLWLGSHKDIFIGNPIVTNDRVSFTIKKGTDRTALDPKFYLTEGARLTMKQDGADVEANGVTRDFSIPQIYTTHSQDGAWSKDYSVSFNYPQPISLMSFEHYDLDATGNFQQWYEVDTLDTQNPRRNYWSSGNPGFKLTGMAKGIDDYPTVANNLGVRGNCVKLTTLSTGGFGQGVNMPIAAGNLFIGEFRVAQAMLFPRKATLFGLQLVGGRPLRLEGYYKYTAGPAYTDRKLQVHPELHDTADIYAVVYEAFVTDKKGNSTFVPLNGDDVLSSSRIVMMARIADPGEPQEWKHFAEPFRLMPGKEFDEELLRKDGYAIAVVATSSRQGAYFEGAIGSTLYVDELRVVWDGEDNDSK